MSSTKFTLEVKGIELPQSAQEEISKALNQTLMHKIGELDLANGKEAHASHPFFITEYLINGGRIEKLMNQGLLNAIRKELNIPNAENLSVNTVLL